MDSMKFITWEGEGGNFYNRVDSMKVITGKAVHLL